MIGTVTEAGLAQPEPASTVLSWHLESCRCGRTHRVVIDKPTTPNTLTKRT